jgi:very-short-patch-repair endonuclease
MDLDRWWTEIHDIHEFRSKRSPDEAIALVAARLGGVIDRAQLSALGLGRGAIDHRILVGRLRPLYRGVYAVGHEAVSPRGRLVAGLLVGGSGAALSHRTAAALLKLTASVPSFVEITTTRTRPRDRPGLVFHRGAGIAAHARHALPVTSPMRTLLDLAATRPRAEVERACSEALVLRLVSAGQLARQQGRGSAVLAGLAGEGVGPTRSELERRFLRAVLKAGLPRPEVNRRIGRHEVDFHWPEQRLAVETDGARFHGHHAAVRRDQARDAALQLCGYAVLRFTWQEIVAEPAAVAVRVARFLSRPASRRAS